MRLCAFNSSPAKQKGALVFCFVVSSIATNVVLYLSLFLCHLQHKEVLGKGAFKKVYPPMDILLLSFCFAVVYYAFETELLLYHCQFLLDQHSGGLDIEHLTGLKELKLLGIKLRLQISYATLKTWRGYIRKLICLRLLTTRILLRSTTHGLTPKTRISTS